MVKNSYTTTEIPEMEVSVEPLRTQVKITLTNEELISLREELDYVYSKLGRDVGAISVLWELKDKLTLASVR